MRRWIAVLLLSTLAPGIIGCGGASTGPKLYPVRGRVTYKGQALPQGTITFGALDAKQGTPDSATITNGSYTIKRGLAASDYVVLVEAISGSARELEKNKTTAPKSPIPEKYRDAKASDLKFTVKAGPNTANFDLQD